MTAMRVLAAPAIATLLLILQPVAALAHPLGNFTVNRYSRIEVSTDSVRVRYVVDMAEIPTFQAMPSLDTNGDGRVTDAEKEAFASRTLSQIVRNLHLTLDGADVPLRAGSHEIELLPGQAGLQTLRLAAWIDGPAAGHALQRLTGSGEAALRLDFRDDNDPERIGWREIVVHTDGISVSSEASPSATGRFSTADATDELRRYPDGMLTSPLDVRQVHVTVAPIAIHSTADSHAAPRPAAGPSLARAADGFAELLTRAASATLTPRLVAIALLTVLGLGAAHALSPGHGKTIVGAYLVGTRGTPRHALFLGVVVTAVHTAGVFTLGLATLYASQYVVPESIYPWMSLVSGLLVLAMGLTLLRSRFQSARGAGHHHLALSAQSSALTHDHDHGLGSHTHALPGADGAPLTWRSLLALGVSGGLLPCPSALVVMLGAIALHRVAFGLVLIVAFSTGLAGTLMAVGLLMVYSGRAAGRLRLGGRLGLDRKPAVAALVRLLPVASAGVVALAGLALSVEAARQLGPVLGVAGATDVPWPALQLGGLALLGTALALGLRHGVDWDHIAAIADIAGTPAAPSRRPAMGLALLYALGHALVVVVLGIAALAFGAILPAWVDPLMERVVGLTLLALGVCVVYSLVRFWRGGEDFRLQSRWMLVFGAARRAWWRFQTWAHGHSHDGGAPVRHVHRVDQYGPKAAFGVGVIHGIGAETGTQVLIIAAVGGAASQGLGLWMLLAFVLGLLVSNTSIAILASTGFARSGHAKPLYVATGCAAAAFSLVVGLCFVFGAADSVPSLR